MTDKEVMRLALIAMENIHKTGDTQIFDMYDAPEIIPALRAALAQPKREWQNLTDEEIMSLLPGAVRLPPGWADTVRAIEAKLKEKNR
jgi:hypothetical protein